MADSTGVIRSNALSIYISTSATPITGGAISSAAYWDLVANSTSGEISITRNAIEVTDKGSNGREHLLDFADWTLSAECQVRYDGTMPANGFIRNASNLQALFNAKTLVAVAWTTGAQTDGTPGTTDPVVFGMAYITEYSENAGLNDVATLSLTFTGEGQVYFGTVPDADKFQVPTS